jgi:hypothetical protein
MDRSSMSGLDVATAAAPVEVGALYVGRAAIGDAFMDQTYYPE